MDDLFVEYDSILRSIADRFAPVRLHAPRFDAECMSIHASRMSQKRKALQENQNDADRSAFSAAARRKHDEFAAKKNKYWSERIAKQHSSRGKLWQSLSKLLRRDDQRRRDTLQTTSVDSFTTR